MMMRFLPQPTQGVGEYLIIVFLIWIKEPEGSGLHGLVNKT